MEQDNGTYSELNSMGSPLAGLSQTMPYRAPAGYFEHFAANAIKTVTAGTEWSSLPKADTGSVPELYFETLPARILQRVKEQQGRPARAPIQIAFGQMKWAAAAIIILTIGIGGYGFLFNRAGVAGDAILASVPDKEIKDYLTATYHIDVNKVISNKDLDDIKVNNEDIIRYLNETGWEEL